MAATTAKENLMCLAFAYFMESRPEKPKDDDHFKKWQTLFEELKITEIRSKYSKYLEYTFNYASIKTQYSFVTGKSSPTHVVVAYRQIEKLYHSGIISKRKDYKLYTQSSSFTKSVKDECLKKLKDVFSIRGNAEILSPVDFYIVNVDEVKNIEKLFSDNIIKPKGEDILINYYKNKDKTYEHMMAKLLKNKDLVGISHKMLGAKTSVPSVKITGNVRNLGKYDVRNIDPYAQFVIILKDKRSTQVEKLIDEVIEIDYDSWDIREQLDSSSWKLPFNFNYTKLNDQFADTTFKLEPLPSGGSGSYNGKFSIRVGAGKDTPWVAGMAPKTIEPILRDYSGYNTIMDMLATRRVYAFLKSSGLKKETDITTPEGVQALVFLKRKQFHSYSELKAVLDPYYEKLGNSSTLNNYLKECIKVIRSEGKYKTHVDSINEKFLENHYISLQMAYLWIAGRRTFKTYLKKQIFFTVFGAISKKSFGRITSANDMVDSLTKKVMVDKTKEVKVSITSAPHVILM